MSSELEKECDELRLSLQCPVCLDIFSKPVKILPCLHSVCLACLNHLFETSSSSSSSSETACQANCPVCRRAFEVPLQNEGGTSSLLDNDLAHYQLERLSKLTAFLEASSFDDSSSPPPLPSIPSSSLLETSPQLEKQKEETLGLIEEVQGRRHHIVTSLSLIELVENKIQETTINQRERIAQTINELKQKLDQHQEFLNRDLDDKAGQRLEKLGLQRKQLERDLECLDNSVSVSRAIVQSASEEQLRVHLPRITDQLSRLRDDESFVKPPANTTHPEFFVDNPKAIDILTSSLRIVPTQSDDILVQVRKISKETDFASVYKRSKILGFFSKIEQEVGQPCGFNSPIGVAVDHENNIIVCDHVSNKIKVIDQEGKVVRMFGEKGPEPGHIDGPWGVAVDRHSNLIISDWKFHRIQMFDGTGRFIRTIVSKQSFNPQFSPYGVAVSPDGNLFVSDYGNRVVQEFDLEGKWLRSVGSGKLLYPRGVVVDQNGNVLVSDHNKHRVFVFDKDGEEVQLGELSHTSLRQPCGLAIDHFHNIIVCDQEENLFQVFDPKGKRIATIGARGTEIGHLQFPMGVSIDHNNRIIISEYKNNRLQVFC